MNPVYTAKHYLKLGRWQWRRVKAALRWGPGHLNKMPAVLGNAMPKSGSHLIIQVLQGLVPLGPFVNPGFPPVNRGEDNSQLPEQKILANIQRMRPGDFNYGYLPAREPFLSALTAPGRATIFVYRDPRDMIVSHVFYATRIHQGHAMHRYYTEALDSMEARINAAIQGVAESGSELPPVRKRYQAYFPWLEQPGVLCLRFEELVLERDKAFGSLLDYLEKHNFTPGVTRSQALEALNAAIVPQRSGTFRKGQPGGWKEHFTPANKTLFKDLAGDILIQLGYERDQNW